MGDGNGQYPERERGLNPELSAPLLLRLPLPSALPVPRISGTGVCPPLAPQISKPLPETRSSNIVRALVITQSIGPPDVALTNFNPQDFAN